MQNPTTIFLAGVVGVFIGMTMIFVAIHINAWVARRLGSKKDTE